MSSDTTSKLPVKWIKNTANDEYFDFLRLDLGIPYFNGKRGVYLIWYVAPIKPKVIRIGHGNIGDRLRGHREDPNIIEYSKNGALKVTWTVFDAEEEQLAGVDAYLHGYYKPIFDKCPQNVIPIPVTPLI